MERYNMQSIKRDASDRIGKSINDKMDKLIDNIVIFGITNDDVNYYYEDYCLSIFPEKMILRQKDIILEIYAKNTNFYQI
jgi:hypothetical protein